MIYEYALEPSLLNTAAAFRYFSEKFGYGRGRVISRYPKHWEKMVYESLGDCLPVEKARIEEGLRRLKPVLHPRFHEWRDGSWIENAINEHTKRPFRAIIASSNPGDLDFVLEDAELTEAAQPLWNVEAQRRITRSAEELANCARLLLGIAQEILFVDPHFDPAASRFRNPFAQFLDVIAKRPSRVPPIRIEYHTGDTSAGTKEFFESECRARLPRCIPDGLKVRFVRWQQSYLHNRFILTEKGGLKFSIGLDAHDENPPREDIVDLLTAQAFAETWNEYQRQVPKFPLVEDTLIIVGSKHL